MALAPARRARALQRIRRADPEFADHLTRLLMQDGNDGFDLFQLPLEAIDRSFDQRLGFGPGMRVGAFALVRELGHGGMGRVFLARRVDGGFEQRVAIKFVRRELMRADVLARFAQERDALAALDHPAVARLLDASALEDGTPYVVMEYVDGENLVDWCARRALDIRQRVALFRRVLAAVSHAHRQLIVHRDLKPGNVLVTADGDPKLLDFGLAKWLDPDAGAIHTGTGERFLTPRHAAPEQFLGLPVGVGCDVYALGALLYELLSGAPPFDVAGLRAAQIERQVLDLPPPPMLERITARDPAAAATLRSALRGDLEQIVQRCLRKRPEQRYLGVDALDDDLARVQLRRPILARRNDRWYRLRCFVSRNRLQVAATAIVCVTVLGALIALGMQAWELAQARDRARQALELLSGAFLAASPAGRPSGHEVTARQVLDAARPRLESLAESQPALHAELASVIAEVEVELGLPAQAARLASAAQITARRAGLAPQQQRRIALVGIRAAIGAGDYAVAEHALRQAERDFDLESPEWWLTRAQLLYHQGESTAARAWIERALAALADRAAPDALATRARMHLAEVVRMSGDTEAFLEQIDGILRWQRSSLPQDHPAVSHTRLRRIDALQRLQRIPEASREAFAVVDAIEAGYGADSLLSASARTALGQVLIADGRSAEAVPHLRRALDYWHRSVGRAHQNSLRTAFNLAQALASDRAAASEAESIYREVISHGTQTLGSERPSVLLWRLALAQFLLEAKRDADARAVLEDGDTQAGLKVANSYNRSWHARLQAALERSSVDAAQ